MTNLLSSPLEPKHVDDLPIFTILANLARHMKRRAHEAMTNYLRRMELVIIFTQALFYMEPLPMKIRMCIRPPPCQFVGVPTTK